MTKALLGEPLDRKCGLWKKNERIIAPPLSCTSVSVPLAILKGSTDFKGAHWCRDYCRLYFQHWRAQSRLDEDRELVCKSKHDQLSNVDVFRKYLCS